MDKKALLKIAGTLLWVSCLLPYLKAWLNIFYTSANRPSERWLSATPWQTWEVLQNLTSQGVLRRAVPSLGVEEGWKLFKIGKTKLGNPLRWKGWWPAAACMLGFYNPHTRRVRVQAKLEAAAQRWEHALLNTEQLLHCRMLPACPGFGAADAQATENHASLGGWFVNRKGKATQKDVHWFFLRINKEVAHSFFQILGSMQVLH